MQLADRTFILKQKEFLISLIAKGSFEPRVERVVFGIQKTAGTVTVPAALRI